MSETEHIETEVEVEDGAEAEYTEEPELQTEEASEGEAEEVAQDDPFSEFGGRDSVAQAAQLAQRMNDPNGALEVFFQLGEAFGIPLNKVDALFQEHLRSGGQAAQAETATAEEPADDDLMTYGQFKELLDKQVLNPMQEQQRQATRAQAQQTVTQTFQELGAAELPEPVRLAILQLGDRHLNGKLDPQSVAAAVKAGYAEYQTLVQSVAPKPKPASAGKRVPKPASGGGGPASQPPSEPKDVKEAIARARKRLLG